MLRPWIDWSLDDVIYSNPRRMFLSALAQGVRIRIWCDGYVTTTTDEYYAHLLLRLRVDEGTPSSGGRSSYPWTVDICDWFLLGNDAMHGGKTM